MNASTLGVDVNLVELRCPHYEGSINCPGRVVFPSIPYLLVWRNALDIFDELQTAGERVKLLDFKGEMGRARNNGRTRKNIPYSMSFRIRYELPHKTYEKPHKREIVSGDCFLEKPTSGFLKVFNSYDCTQA